MKKYFLVFILFFSFSNCVFCGTKLGSGDNLPDKSSLNSSPEIKIAMILPLYYDRVEQLNFTKYNIEDKKKQRFRSFEYLPFYEGARVALDKLEKDGYNVSLYVYDVAEDDTLALKNVLQKPEMKEMDLIIPLLFQKSFAICALFSKQERIPIVNPMSQNEDVVKNNPYVFKVQPSKAAEVMATIRYIKSNFYNPNLIILYTNAEKALMETYSIEAEKNKWTWCAVDYNKYSKRIFEKIDAKKENIYISLVNKRHFKDNEGYVNTLLSQLNDRKNLPTISLIGQYSWLDYQSLDLSLLQKFNYHFVLSYYNDYTNLHYADFIKEYRKHFVEEPDKVYAALGYDIMIYFVAAIKEYGKSIVSFSEMNLNKDMISPFEFYRLDDRDGWQNRKTSVYRMIDYRMVSVGK
ncbi:MAG: hypothetical protein LBM25_03025 [Bacteroidales bacterium]|jgi:hypothetical protein|nr:hypothetical protein [Bacteroidales bacterium]